jgi:hypothetical protein
MSAQESEVTTPTPDAAPPPADAGAAAALSTLYPATDAPLLRRTMIEKVPVEAIRARGVPAVPQLHFNAEPPAPEKIEPVGQAAWQPRGGLWTFTPDEGAASFAFWTGLFANIHQFAGEKPRWSKMRGKEVRGWLLYPSPSARVAVIDNLDDLLQLGNGYGWDESRWVTGHDLLGQPQLSAPVYSLNFPAIAKDFDAVRVTDAGVERLETVKAGKYRLAFWHAESTCWFRWCFERVEEVGPVCHYMKHKQGDTFMVAMRTLRSAQAARGGA